MRLDAAYALEAVQRYRRQHRGSTWTAIAKWVVGAPVVALLGFFLWAKLWVPAGIFGLVLLLLVLSRQIDRLVLQRRLGRHPWKDLVLKLALTDELLTLETELTEEKMKWPLISAAREFSDGFLLIIAPGSFYWLGAGALIEGTAEGAREILKRHVTDYSVV